MVDLASYIKESEKEGFIVLHSGVQQKEPTLILMNPVQKLNSLPKEKDRRHVHVGHMAYPNLRLKNDIPNVKFYSYLPEQVIKVGIPLSSSGLTRRYHPDNSIKNKLLSGDSRIKSENDKRGSSHRVTGSYKTSGKLEQSVTKAQYLKKIAEIKKLLVAGEIYQMNYAIRFRKKFSGSPYSLYLNLIDQDPAEFPVFMNCGDYQIVSNSPERLFKVEKGKIVTQPIKGTAAKAANSKLEIRNSKSETRNPKKPYPPQIPDQVRNDKVFYNSNSNLTALLNSEKERAELDMITDLERNDVGKICKYGTLKLTKEREVMELSNLWHTYSEVQGQLPRHIKRSDVINAMFPGGSVTGCPKKRAMYYIEKLEKLPRNIFTGSIFYMNGNFIDSSICIRTALIQNGYIEYWAGGGIVMDSDPESEYKECLLKAEKFFEIL